MKIKIGAYPKKGNRKKIDIKIDGYDCWNLDNTLAHIIYPALIHLRLHKHGVPAEFVDVGGEDWSQQESFDFYKESHDEAWTAGAKRWEEALDKMIWSFEQLCLVDYNEKYHHGKSEYDWVKSDKTFANPITGKVEETFRMVDKNPDEHFFDTEGLRLHEERIQEGLDLFGKHYRSLWD
jgi:hypothetical protein